tara:strand:- start:4 stop:723 length:720 start_codon:yes stop_codon:yes gene_type:complete
MYVGPDIVDDGLALALDAGSTRSYSGSGTTFNDLSSNSVVATISNFTYSTAYGGVLSNSTTGTGAKGISVPLTDFPKTSGSLGIWARPTSWNNSNGLFVNQNDDGTNASNWFWVGAYGSGSVLYFRLGNDVQSPLCCANDNTVSSWSSVHALNTWGYYLVTWDSGGESKIYFNGVLLSTKSITAIPSTNPSTNGRIGLGHNSANSMWLGQIGSTRWYNTVLTAAEITQNYNAQKSRFGL